MDKYTFSTHPKAEAKSVISGPNYRFTVLTDRLVRYEWAEDGNFEDRASTFAINRNLPVPDFRIIDNAGLEIITEHFHLSYDKERFSPDGMVAHLNARTTKYGTAWRFGIPATMNLGGTARTLDLCDGRCDMGHGILSKEGFAVVDDSKSMLFDGHGFVAGRLPGDRIDGYLFAYGRDYKAAIKALYAISGKQPIVPRYALGNWWSRYYPYHQDEYVRLMREFRTRDIPMSVAVLDMDWHLVSDERVPHAGWTGYTWNRKLFPDPKAFRQQIHDLDLKITLNDHPHNGVHSHEDSYEEMAKFIGHDTKDKTPILFDPTNPKFMEAFLCILHRKLEAEACDFWWIDWQQGSYSKIPGIDPMWLLNHFQYLDDGRDGKVPLILSRYAGPGSHRYPVGFSGDTLVTWASLEFQPEFTATASNIGYGWWSHDIGGHIHGSRDDELVTRWVQLGVFSPIMRLHSSVSRWMSKEPWLYRSESASAMTKFLQVRHRLVPYLYTHNAVGSADDEPIIQPMYWSYPYQEEAYSVPNQFFFGPELVVVPIVQPRHRQTDLASAKAWLPPLGRHVDIFTGTVYDGDREMTLYRSLQEYPVLAHEGSIIPLDMDEVPRNGCLNPTGLQMLIVVGRDGQYKLLEDTRDDSSHADQQIHRTQRVSEFQFTQSEGRLTAKVNRRLWSFRFLSITSVPKDLKIMINETEQTELAKIQGTEYPDVPSLFIQCPPGPSDEYTITIDLGSNPQMSVIDHQPRLEQMILDYQIEFKMKNRLWGIVEQYEKRPLHVTLGNLMALGYDEAIVGPIAELLLADSRAARARE